MLSELLRSLVGVAGLRDILYVSFVGKLVRIFCVQTVNFRPNEVASESRSKILNFPLSVRIGMSFAFANDFEIWDGMGGRKFFFGENE